MGMRWIVIVFGLAGVIALLIWLSEDVGFRRGERTGADVTVPPTTQSTSAAEAGEQELLVEQRGIIVNEDGRPIARATVEQGDTPRRAQSDAEGRFALRVPPSGAIVLKVAHDEYVDLTHFVHSLDIENELRITLQRGARYRLRVVGPDGKPVANAKIRITRETKHGLQGIWGWSQWDDLRESATDERGESDLGALPFGTLDLVVEEKRFALHREVLEVATLAAVDHLVTLSSGGAVEGVVTGPEGDPVVGARVFTDDREARSDDTGRFRIERISAGPATVRAEKEGYGPGYFGQDLGWGEPVPVQIVAGETIPAVTIRLGAAAWVEGRIVDDEGQPVPEARIQATAFNAFQTKSEFKSDADGRFLIGPFNIEGETTQVHLYVSKEGFTPDQLQREFKSGARTDFGDIKLARSPVLRGRVVDMKGRGVPGANVTANPGWSSTTSGKDGVFELSVRAKAKVVLKANAAGREQKRSRRVRIDTTEESQREGIVLTLLEPLTIRGTVTDGEGGPRAGVTLAARPLDLPEEQRNLATEWGYTDEQGAYSVGPLSPGRYRVGLTGTAAGVYVWHDTNWLKSPAPVDVDAGDEGVDFSFPLTGGVVTARIVSKRTGRPIRHVRYGLIRFRMLLPRFVGAGEWEHSEGKFREELSEVGTWAIDFQADGHASYRTPRFSLKKGETKDLGTIRLGAGATLVGQVRDAQGMAVPYARINVLSPKFETNDNEPFTGRDGRFRIEGIAPGFYTVFAISPRHPIGIASNLNLREAEEHEVEIRFARSAPLELIVKDQNGRPIKGASLSWSFPAIAPLSSRLFQNKIPPGYGSHIADASGRIRQHSLPAGPVTLVVEANGFKTATKQVRLVAGETTRLEIQLTPK